VTFLCIGNPVVQKGPPLASTTACGPCVDSVSTLKEQIEALDSMVLVEGDEGESPATDDEESLA
jgi:hypothetical protein